MDRADRIIKINESLEKIQLNELAPLIGLALNAVKGLAGSAISKVGGAVLRTGNKALNALSGGNDFVKTNIMMNSIQGAQGGMNAATSPGAQQSQIGSPVMGDESEGTPGTNRPNKIM